MNEPYIRDKAVFIPTNANGSISVPYQNKDVVLSGEALCPFWGYEYLGDKNYRYRASDNPEADLAAVMAVYTTNTSPPVDSDVVYTTNTSPPVDSDVVFTSEALPPLQHPETGTEIPVPECRVELTVELIDLASWIGVSGIHPPNVLGHHIGPTWGVDTSRGKVRKKVFAAGTMSGAFRRVAEEMAVIKDSIQRYKKNVAEYNRIREANIAAADAEYARRANS